MKFLTLLLGVLLVGCSSVSREPNSSEQTDSQALYEQIGQGLEKIQQGKPEQAINHFFNPVIEQCEQRYRLSSQRVYSARSQVETLYYLLLAAADEQEAIAVDTSCSEALFFKGYASLELGDLNSAEAFVRQALELSPVNSRYQSELGHIYQVKKEWQQALQLFVAAEEYAETYTPDYLRVRELTRAKRGQGFSLIELGHWDKAEALFKECLQYDPKDSVSRAELQYIDQLKHSF